jgi:hypothetical protein
VECVSKNKKMNRSREIVPETCWPSPNPSSIHVLTAVNGPRPEAGIRGVLAIAAPDITCRAGQHQYLGKLVGDLLELW